MTSSSNRPRSKSSGQRERSAASAQNEMDKASMVQIKCKFCGNTFMALPRRAVCVKCGRPANKPLALPWMAVSFLVPVIGFVNSLIIRSHSPFASTQGLMAAAAGSAFYLLVFFVLHNVLKLF